MTMHFYAFGSICRGEIDHGSDIDLLACISKPIPEIDPKKFSIYTYERIRQLWKEGNPFAWHLHIESRLLFSCDTSDFINDLGAPNAYENSLVDCLKFQMLFTESHNALTASRRNAIFNLSCMFLAVRNFATCYSFTVGQPIFSRTSPCLLKNRLPIADEVFDVFVRARILSTRGYGHLLSEPDMKVAKDAAPTISNWMQEILGQGELS